MNIWGKKTMWEAGWGRTLLIAVLLFSLTAGLAHAHVVVYPKEAQQGAYEKFTVRVPTETDAATVQVRVEIPADVDISRFEPKYGWTYELERDENEKITAVTWQAEGEGLSATEFGEFHMQGKVGNEASELVWNAIQTYADGTVVEWTGSEDADRPASVTAVHAAASEADGEELEASSNSDASWLQWVTLFVAIAALVLSLIAVQRAQKRA